MKKYLVLTVLSLFMTASYAQIDRSTQPKPGPAPKINLKDPARFELKNGLKVLVVENHKLPRVRVQLSIDNPPIMEGDKAGLSALTASMMGKGSKNIPKDEFYEEVDFLGATVFIGDQSAFASSLSKYFPRILELMADAALNPNFLPEEFDKEKEKIITAIKSEEKDVSAVADRVQLALAYGKNHPFGEFMTEETVNNVTLADVEQFYRSYFVPANAYLVVIGDVEFENVKELVTKAFTPWSKAAPPSFTYSDPKDVQYTQINFVDMPNAVQSEVAVQNITDLKMKDEDYLDALLANRILGGGGQARLFKNLREDKGYTYGSYSGIRANKYSPMRFNAYAQVRNAVTDSSVVEILKEIDKITTEPVSDEELANAKAKYAGSFVMALEKPETVAEYALNIETEDLPKDFYETYLERLDAITKEDVLQAAQKHFSTTNARVVVTGKGSDVLENLEKVTFKGKDVPVLYFDKYANKTEKPDYNAAVPEGMDAKTVLENYIQAIGGKAKLEGVESYSMVAEAEMQGMKLELEMKKTAQDQFMQNVKVQGNSMQKQVLDGDSGYMVVQGQRKDLSPEEISKIKEESAAFPELNYLAAGDVSLEGIEPVGDKKAYKLKISDNKTAFYDVETGLKVQEINTQEMQGQQMTSTLGYGDYQEISGIKFPFKLMQSMGPQNFEFLVKEIKVNEGVDASDFK
ncbi:MAG: insulinase family protein [Muricauda sp.]|jgi:predicted Zn-dependent peptidase|nr:pitrilysin family protein [Allomuricauda sp.]MBO6587751.1 insulinase family protein [Allomuricauda sp.]MBO6617376.1 insulinase family protein [Allomuricauda sp.]MBO6643613.1 insulinase family protein [Allomuricauda sp.]MBO6745711.1 insulinase family protein [Allomuricauda sp.]MBO6828019.1 insulinase family protein [Allomuricauda sp.]